MTNDHDLKARVKKQVEFYFGDSNLPQDKFLRGKCEESAEGWVDLVVITTFSRMRSITNDVSVIIEALSDSTVVELSEDSARIRRREPLPESADNAPRTMYVSGIPASATLEAIESFMSNLCLEVCTTKGAQAIRMLKDPRTKSFSGATFVEMANLDDAVKLLKFVGENPESKALYWEGDIKIKFSSKLDYFESRNKERLLRENEKNADKESKAEAQRLHTEKLVKERVAKATISGEGVKLPHDAIKSALADTFPLSYADTQLIPGVVFLRFRETVAPAFVSAYEGKTLEVSGVTLCDISLPTAEEE